MVDTGSDYAPGPEQGMAALATAKLGERQFEWVKDYYNTVLTPSQLANDNLNRAAAEQGLRISSAQEARANDTYQAGLVFRPAEQQMASAAIDANTAGAKQDFVQRAVINTDAAFDNAIAAERMDLTRRGVDTDTAQQLGAGNRAALARATALSTAANKAYREADAMGFAKLQTASSLGRGINSDSVAQIQAALSGSSAAGAAAQRTIQGQQANAQIMQGGFAGATQAQTAAGGMFGNINNQMATIESGNAQSRGQTVGAAAGVIAAIAL